MVEIVPAILAKSREELIGKLQTLDGIVKRVQIDVMDGKFVPNRTILPEEFGKIDTKLKMEQHLMVENSIEHIRKLKGNAWMVIIHLECCEKNVEEALEEIRKIGAKAGIALNPETPIEKILPYLDKIDMVLVMTVTPGFQRQGMVKEALEKVRVIRKIKPKMEIEVDGGINKHTISEAAKAGATVFAAGSAVFGSEDMKKAVEELERTAREAQ